MAHGIGESFDVDKAFVMDRLQTAVRESGLTQAAFAKALGTSGSRLSTYLAGSTVPSAAFFVRACRLSHGLRVAAELHRMTPGRALEAAQIALIDGREMWALKMMLQGRDDLAAMLARGSAGADAWECDPGLLGAPAWDALFGALVCHEFQAAGRTLPPWAQAATAADQWVFPNPYFDRDEVRRRTPDWVTERGIYIAARDLVTA